MHTALSYTATLDPSSAATCAPPPAHARAPIHAHRMRQARVPKEWSCARALRCKWITRVADSTNLRRADIQHENCARAHGIRTRHGGPAGEGYSFSGGFWSGRRTRCCDPARCRPAASLGDGGADRLSPRARPWRIRATAEPTGRRDRCEFSAPVPTLFCVATAAARRGSRRGMLKRTISHPRYEKTPGGRTFSFDDPA